MKKILIKNAVLVNENKIFEGDVLLNADRIEKMTVILPMQMLNSLM